MTGESWNSAHSDPGPSSATASQSVPTSRIAATLAGLDLQGREVLVVGAGAVATRRVHDLLAAGAVVRVVSPQASEDLIRSAKAGFLTWEPREVEEADLDGVWLAHVCTGVPQVDAAVAQWAQERRVFCVVASDATLGSARSVATARVGDIAIGVVSTGSPDPRRSVGLRDQITRLLASGVLDASPGRSNSRSQLTLQPGQVALVGGGIGDPDLMTVRARLLLSQADVIITDRLGPTSVLTELADDVEIIYVGKNPDVPSISQERINELLVENALAGRRVVRLKGGDPFVYGRGGEEIQACRAAGVSVVVVPGVSSSLAGPGLAQIPVTHRGATDRVHIVSGHTARVSGGGLSVADLASLADPAVTVVVLMGVRGIPAMAAQALEAQMSAQMPVAIVMQASLPEQRVVRTTLGELTQRAAVGDITSPAVLVLATVAAQDFLDSVEAEPGSDPSA